MPPVDAMICSEVSKSTCRAPEIKVALADLDFRHEKHVARTAAGRLLPASSAVHRSVSLAPSSAAQPAEGAWGQKAIGVNSCNQAFMSNSSSRDAA